MKKNAIILNLLCVTSFLFAQHNYKESFAPVNPEYIKYKASGEKGLIPSYFSISFDQLIKKRAALQLPEKFDLRETGLLSAPRDQGVVNACWTFATYDAIQSVWARMGFETTAYSVENLANCHGYNVTKNQGGTSGMAIAYFARFAGPVYETSDPFINNTSGTCNSSITQNDKVALVSQAFYVPKEVQIIKEMVYRYGGVVTAMSADQFNTQYYNPATFSVYMKQAPAGVILDHAVTIVGWDDTKVIANPIGDNPTNTGAWILKNTVGTAKYDGGYFYASYEDVYIGSLATVYGQRIEKSEVDTVFYYDKLGHVSNYGSGLVDSASVIVKYHSPNEKLITAIGTYTSSAAATIDIEVYQFKNGELLSGLLGKKTGLLCEYPGYHTFDFPIAVSGDFYVRINYKTPGNYFPIPIEKSIPDRAVVDVKPVGLQWAKLYESDSLRSIGTAERQFNLCVNVYAQNTPKQPLFTTDEVKYCISDTVVFKNASVGAYNSYEWNFGVGATPQTATTASVTDSFKVAYATLGIKKVVLKATDGVLTDSIVKGNAVEILSGVPLHIISSATNDSILKNKNIILTARGANSYLWQASASISDTTTNIISFKVGEADEVFKVSGFIGQCAATDSIIIRVYDNCASYDDIEDAKWLTVNTNEGPFSNVCATSEANEPHPMAADSCTAQNAWCPDEDKLYSTLWFKFIAPATDSVKIVTTGLDNKIALYDAIATGTYADIISGTPSNYTILAANDDSSNVVYSATIKPLKLTSGKTYWLQVDGSYGGQEGEMYIAVIGFNAVGLSDAKANLPVVINPVQNELLIIQNAQAVTRVELIDLSGKTLMIEENRGNETLQINVMKLTHGYYLIKMLTEKGLITEKVLMQ